MAKRQSAEEVGDNGDLQALFDSIADQDQAVKPQLEIVASSGGAGDSDDLENLFESVSSTAKAAQTAKPAKVSAVRPAAAESSDSADLEALFDEVSAKGPATHAPGHAATTLEERQENVFLRVGNMTRLLHDTIRELGYDRMISETAQQLPDARERLSYISKMTEQAASRVLNATDIAKPIQDRVEKSSIALHQRWEKLYAKELSVDEFKALASETRSFFSETSADAKIVNAQLLEVMMAQDFQDLTGQVIKRVVDMATTLESELLKVLIEVVPEDKRTPDNEGLLNGPVINAEGRSDVVTGQEQVDDLLESLGF